MEKKVERRYVDEEIFVANDGTRFNSERDCVLHETELAKRGMEADLEKLEIKELSGYCPLDINGFGVNDSSEFTWYKVNKEADLELIMNYYEKDHFGSFCKEYPTIICVEVVCGTDCYFYNTAQMKNDTIEFWERLGVKISFGTEEAAEQFANENFIDDEEKMIDFESLSKEQFLQSYSYLTEAEYDNTMEIYKDRVKNYYFKIKLCDGYNAEGKYKVRAMTEKGAINKVYEEICEKLYKALPELGIEVCVELCDVNDEEEFDND